VARDFRAVRAVPPLPVALAVPADPADLEFQDSRPDLPFLCMQIAIALITCSLLVGL